MNYNSSKHHLIPRRELTILPFCRCCFSNAIPLIDIFWKGLLLKDPTRPLCQLDLHRGYDQFFYFRVYKCKFRNSVFSVHGLSNTVLPCLSVPHWWHLSQVPSGNLTSDTCTPHYILYHTNPGMRTFPQISCATLGSESFSRCKCFVVTFQAGHFYHLLCFQSLVYSGKTTFEYWLVDGTFVCLGLQLDIYGHSVWRRKCSQCK